MNPVYGRPAPSFNLGFIGLGVVGGGVADALARCGREIEQRHGYALHILQAAVKNPNKKRSEACASIDIGTDPERIIANREIDIVVELMGGIEPARSLVLAAIEQHKPVVTANKALLAECGEEIFAAAARWKTPVFFEAAVAGAVPIVRALGDGLAGDRIGWIAGIVNGTSNYILSSMQNSGASLAEALREAQKKGYAEADPSLDINGGDSCHKLSLLSALAFGTSLGPDKIPTEGIEEIEADDIGFARELGYCIKHVAKAQRRDGGAKSDRGIELSVHPALVPEKSLLARVDGAMNAVLVNSQPAGPTLYYGAGAGAGPTASAVLSNLVDAARSINVPASKRYPAILRVHGQKASILPPQEREAANYLRLRVADEVGVMAKITAILARVGISLEVIRQFEAKGEGSGCVLILLTTKVVEKKVDQALAELAREKSVLDKPVRLRVETLDQKPL